MNSHAVNEFYTTEKEKIPLSIHGKAENFSLNEPVLTPVSQSTLLWIFIIGPAFFFLALFDKLFLNMTIAHLIPSKEAWPIVLNALLIFPHVCGGANQFLDLEYLKYYKLNLLIGIPAILILTWFGPSLFGRELFGALLSTYTIFHQFGQQLGLTKIGLVKIDNFFHAWKWIGSIIIIYANSVIFPSVIKYYNLDQMFMVISLLLFIPWLLLSWKISTSARNRTGAYYVWGNVITTLTFIALYKMDYYFFAALVPMTVHSITAFTIYIAHDQNRNRNQYLNIWFRVLSKLKLPKYLITIIAAYLVAIPFAFSNTPYFMMNIYVAMTIFHYYSESFVWKSAYLHRRSILFR